MAIGLCPFSTASSVGCVVVAVWAESAASGSPVGCVVGLMMMPYHDDAMMITTMTMMMMMMAMTSSAPSAQPPQR